jgi:hypothetical protein
VIRIQPTIHTDLELSRDYGLVTVEEYIDPWDQDKGVVRVKPTKAGEDVDLTTTWTTRYELDLGNPA